MVYPIQDAHNILSIFFGEKIRLFQGVCDFKGFGILWQIQDFHNWFVVWISTPLKNISQFGSLFPICGEKKRFQTTNQINFHSPAISPNHRRRLPSHAMGSGQRLRWKSSAATFPSSKTPPRQPAVTLSSSAPWENPAAAVRWFFPTKPPFEFGDFQVLCLIAILPTGSICCIVS